MLPDKCKILYEDADILVCVKPPGIASETKNVRCQDMASLLRGYLSEKGKEPYAGMVHRLDQPVEGILVFGKHPKSTAALCRQMAQGHFSKIYLALTQGAMPAREGQLEDYLKKDSRLNLSRVVSADTPGAKKAVLQYRVLETYAECGQAGNQDKSRIKNPAENLVKIELLTGRHHQIRVQMANLGTPIAGDLKYGSSPAPADSCLKLCACELAFVHPVTKKNMRFQISPCWQKSTRKYHA